MPPSLYFGCRRRRGISELYASMLMIGVTLSLGGAVTIGAIGQFGQQTGSASVAGSLVARSQAKLVSLVYEGVSPGTGGCTGTYQGNQEGDVLTLVLYDYGSATFSPSIIAVNSTLYQGSYPSLSPGVMWTYTLTLTSCAHSSGESLMLIDASGDEVQFAT